MPPRDSRLSLALPHLTVGSVVEVTNNALSPFMSAMAAKKVLAIAFGLM